jgi:hypothetical protein
LFDQSRSGFSIMLGTRILVELAFDQLCDATISAITAKRDAKQFEAACHICWSKAVSI